VKKKSIQLRLGSSSIQRVSRDRMPDGSEMDANLVSSSRPDSYFQERILLETPKHFPFCEGAASSGELCRHASAAHRIASDRLFDPPLVVFHHTLY